MSSDKKASTKMSTAPDIVHSLSFSTSQEAWERLNELFLETDPVFFDHNAVVVSNMLAVFNTFIKIKKAWVDPNFDYGKMFNYREQKWNSLLGNYLDLNRLDLLRSQIRHFSNKKSSNYNLSYLFNNSHSNGKGCLLSATFSKRMDEDIPCITLVIRSSEITKRLIFDLLLIQRMGEYVYGSNSTFGLNLFVTQMYCNAETLLMYNTYKPVKRFLKRSNNQFWKDQAKSTFKKFFDNPESFGRYKVFLRSAKCINPEAYNHVPVSMLAKDLNIVGYEHDVDFPENCITLTQRKKYLKRLKEREHGKRD